MFREWALTGFHTTPLKWRKDYFVITVTGFNTAGTGREDNGNDKKKKPIPPFLSN
jgi:hypothetical protein